MADENFVETDGEAMPEDDAGYGGSLTATLRQATAGTTPGASEPTRNSTRTGAEPTDDLRSTLYRNPETLDDPEGDDDPFSDGELDPSSAPERNPKNTPPENGQRENPQAPRTAPPNETAADVFAVAKAEGVDLTGKYRNPQDAIRGLVHAHKLVGQRNEAAQMWEALRSDESFQREAWERLNEKFGPPPPIPGQSPAVAGPKPGESAAPPATQPAAAARPAPPKWNPAWKHHFNADGTPKPNADPNVIAAVEEFRADRQLLQEDPQAYFAKYFLGDVESRAQAAAEAKFKAAEEARRAEEEKRRQEQEAGSAVRQIQTATINRLRDEKWFDWIYEPGYEIVGNDVRGNYTPRGEAFRRFVDEAAKLTDNGIPLYPHPMQRALYARQKVYEAELGRAGNGQAEQPGNTAPLERTPGGNVGGGLRPGEYPAGMTLKQKMAHDLRAAGAQLT